MLLCKHFLFMFWILNMNKTKIWQLFNTKKTYVQRITMRCRLWEKGWWIKTRLCAVVFTGSILDCKRQDLIAHQCASIAKNWVHLKQASKYRAQRGMRDFTGFERSYILFVSFYRSLSVSLYLYPGFLLLLALLVPSFLGFFFSTCRWKEMKRAFAHLSE